MRVALLVFALGLAASTRGEENESKHLYGGEKEREAFEKIYGVEKAREALEKIYGGEREALTNEELATNRGLPSLPILEGILPVKITENMEAWRKWAKIPLEVGEKEATAPKMEGDQKLGIFFNAPSFSPDEEGAKVNAELKSKRPAEEAKPQEGEEKSKEEEAKSEEGKVKLEEANTEMKKEEGDTKLEEEKTTLQEEEGENSGEAETESENEEGEVKSEEENTESKEKEVEAKLEEEEGASKSDEKEAESEEEEAESDLEEGETESDEEEGDTKSEEEVVATEEKTAPEEAAVKESDSTETTDDESEEDSESTETEDEEETDASRAVVDEWKTTDDSEVDQDTKTHLEGTQHERPLLGRNWKTMWLMRMYGKKWRQHALRKRRPRPHHHKKHHWKPHHHRHGRHHHRHPHPRPHPRPRPHPHRKPKFCGKSQCPKYWTLGKKRGYEIRCYAPSTWAYTKADKLDAKYFKNEFMRLLKYIKGANEQNETMKMAVPVATTMQYNLTDHKTTSYMSFYIPRKWNATAPAPDDDKVKIKKSKKFCVYVRSFPGFVMGRTRNMYKQLYMLSKLLRKDKMPYTVGLSVFAGYNSPWQRRHRHNEVWRFVNKKEKQEYSDQDFEKAWAHYFAEKEN